MSYLNSLKHSPADDDALESYARGVVTGAMKQATPNVVGSLLVTIRNKAAHLALERAHVLCPKPRQVKAFNLFVKAYDAWAQSLDGCGGKRFDAMVMARQELDERPDGLSQDATTPDRGDAGASPADGALNAAGGPNAGERAEAGSLLSALAAEVRRLREALARQREFWESLPSGIDYSAREDDASPDDVVAWTAGLAVRAICAALAATRGM